MRRHEEARERERGETDEQKRGRPQVYAIARASGCVHARATDVSKAADAVFVMLMFSLLTAQQRAAPLCAPRRCTGWRMGMQFVPQFLPASVTRNTRPSFSRRRDQPAAFPANPPRRTALSSLRSAGRFDPRSAIIGQPRLNPLASTRDARRAQSARVHSRRMSRIARLAARYDPAKRDPAARPLDGTERCLLL